MYKHINVYYIIIYTYMYWIKLGSYNFLGLPVHVKNLEDNNEKSEPLALFSYMNELGWVVYQRPSSLKPCFDCLLQWRVDWLYIACDCIPFKNISLKYGHHHYRRRTAKFRFFLSAYSLWAGRDLYRAIPGSVMIP